MSTTTQAINIVDQLVKAKIPKETATELIDFVESQRGDLATKQDLQAATEPLKRDINWIKWIGGIGFTALLTVMIYLHSDTKAEMNRRFAEMNQRFTKMEAEMKEIKQLLQRGQR